MITLHYHPLASYCWKVLVGLHETETPFVAHVVDLADAAERDALLRISPFGKFPVIEDPERGALVFESTTILEHLALHHPSARALVPASPEAALEARAIDRLFDLHVHEPMQRIVDDRLRGDGERDPLALPRAESTLRAAYDHLERRMAGRTFAAGASFTLADCAAAPALHYANEVFPLGDEHRVLRSYLARLSARPAFARVLADAAPYASSFPRERRSR